MNNYVLSANKRSCVKFCYRVLIMNGINIVTKENTVSINFNKIDGL